MLHAASINRFASLFRGEIVTPGDGGYDKARSVWCATVHKRPAIVVRPVDAADVATAVRFAREQDLVPALRSGGHSIDGFSTCDDGLVLNLSKKAVTTPRFEPAPRMPQKSS